MKILFLISWCFDFFTWKLIRNIDKKVLSRLFERIEDMCPLGIEVKLFLEINLNLKRVLWVLVVCICFSKLTRKTKWCVCDVTMCAAIFWKRDEVLFQMQVKFKQNKQFNSSLIFFIWAISEYTRIGQGKRFNAT